MSLYYKNNLISLYLGNSLDTLSVVEDGSVNLVLTDPPYALTRCSWDKGVDLGLLWSELRRVGKSNCAYVFTASQPFTTDLINSNRSWFKYEWIWRKNTGTGHLNAGKIPLKGHENIVVFYGKQPVYNPQGLMEFGKMERRGGNGSCYDVSGGRNYQEKTNYPRSVLNFDVVHKPVYPTQKPLDLFSYLVSTYTDVGDLVLDPFAGSGTTLLACNIIGRRCIGVELNEDGCVLCMDRIIKYESELFGGDHGHN